jgi:hypothetical protein
MENTLPSRGRFSASASQPATNHFVKYEPALVEQLKEAKPAGCKVSGRLLSLLYSRLLFWSRYSKWKGSDGKRYFWKSIAELSEEISFSTKQIERALYVLLELGMIVREKLAKHHYRQVWFYHLPLSPHTAEAETSISTHRGTRGTRSTNGTETRTKHHQNIHQAPAPIGAGAPPRKGTNAVDASGSPGAPMRADAGSVPVPASNASIQGKGPRENRQNVCFYQQKNSTKKNTLWEIVEKCELYGQKGIEIINGGRKTASLGFG